MDPPPTLRSKAWPKVNADGKTLTIGPAELMDYLDMLNYIEAQYARCKK